jgi:hypothetical protein
MNIFCSVICKSMVVIYQVIVNLIFCLLCRLFSYFTTKTFKGLDCKIVNFSLSVCVTRSLVLCVCFVDRCLSFCTFPFGHCVVCSSSIYGFWLPLWYLQTLLKHLLNMPDKFLCNSRIFSQDVQSVCQNIPNFRLYGTMLTHYFVWF